MPAERAKVLAAIETKLKGKSLSKNFKDSIASKWAEKIDTDENIDAYIDDREDILLEASSEADRRATEAANKAKGEQKKDEGTPPTDSPPAKPNQEPDSEIAKLTQLVTTLAGTVNAMQQEKQAQSITERFKKDGRLKGVPEFMFKGRIPSKDEDFETAVTELATDYTEFAKQNKLAAFGNDAPPQGQTKNQNEVSGDMKAYLASKKPAQETAK
ncbi:hypothetical protein I2I11_04160 [Pontibacter sp. 172403-2]|uniref:hypothetical protein n=1 Tax=Pontibacter rufus TaxID=2791028 RepID=UPI0018AFDCD8|nr:hypothetical protein [Pontibacter sp. 172403-2]MBF9252478.1 hypothetical protein [Pontibacter sp. 172403-2]